MYFKKVVKITNGGYMKRNKLNFKSETLKFLMKFIYKRCILKQRMKNYRLI